jgi:DNA-binding transcriptional ArsR family regulator
MSGNAALRERLEQTSRLLKVLAHPARFMLVAYLAQGECTVGALEEVTGIRQPNLSQHLAALREGGFVTPRREAKSVFYRLADSEVRRLVAFLIGPDAPGGLACPEKETCVDVQTCPLEPNVPRRPAAQCGMFAVAGHSALSANVGGESDVMSGPRSRRS